MEETGCCGNEWPAAPVTDLWSQGRYMEGVVSQLSLEE